MLIQSALSCYLAAPLQENVELTEQPQLETMVLSIADAVPRHSVSMLDLFNMIKPKMHAVVGLRLSRRLLLCYFLVSFIVSSSPLTCQLASTAVAQSLSQVVAGRFDLPQADPVERRVVEIWFAPLFLFTFFLQTVSIGKKSHRQCARTKIWMGCRSLSSSCIGL